MYKNYKTKIILSSGLATIVMPLWAEQESLLVTANRFCQSSTSVLAPIDIITKQQLQAHQFDNVLDALKLLPGVDFSQYGGEGQLAQLYVRGSKASHVLVLVDGIRLSSADINGAVDFSQIPLTVIQRIEYIRGARSAIYGSDAIGGVINIITNKSAGGSELNLSTGSQNTQRLDATLQYPLMSN